MLKNFRRSFSTALKTKESIGSVKFGRHASGMRYAVDNRNENPTLSRVMINVEGGCRYETSDNKGLSHIIRAFSSLSSSYFSSLGIIRSLEYLGANMNVMNTKENIQYLLEVLPGDNCMNALKYFGHSAFTPVYKPWEIEDNRSRLVMEKKEIEQNKLFLSMEAAHNVAFNGKTLGRSLYIDEDRADVVNTEMLLNYHASMFAPERISIIFQGIDESAAEIMMNELGLIKQSANYNQNFTLPMEIKPAKICQANPEFHGGVMKKESLSPLSYITIAGPGTARGAGDASAFSVLQQLLGTGPVIKYGDCTGMIGRSMRSMKSSDMVQSSAFNLNYKDCGLFGISLISDRCDAKESIINVMSQLKTLALKKPEQQQLDVAKKQAKIQYEMKCELSQCQMESLALDCVENKGECLTPPNYDNVTSEQISIAAKKMLNGGQVAIGVAGNVDNIPSLKQLMN
ncbi:hypothetical protein SNEBB_000862 [Seison nebaliae]|nr:hypothetical protein SNEBB_000862 [Seison nebaliae]